MGLESIELVYAAEEEFHVEFADEDMEKISTPGDFIAHILTLVGSEGGVPPCPTQVVFYKLRRAFVKLTSKQSHAITPDTQLATLLPKSHIHEYWNRAKDMLGARRWPRLRTPPLLLRTIWGLSFSVLIQPVISNDGVGFVTSILLSLSIIISLLLFISPFKNRLPKCITTMRDLTQFVEQTNPSIGSWNNSYTRQQVATVIKQITIEQLGIKESDYYEDARYIEDLGMN